MSTDANNEPPKIQRNTSMDSDNDDHQDDIIPVTVSMEIENKVPVGIPHDPREQLKTCLMLLFVTLQIICHVGIITAGSSFHSSLYNLELSGCCGLIEGNNRWTNSVNSIPGSPGLCSLDLIVDHQALEIVEIDDYYFCASQQTGYDNITLCDIYDGGTIESCLSSGAYTLTDICSSDAISSASKWFLYQEVERWWISAIVISSLLIIMLLLIMFSRKYFKYCAQEEDNDTSTLDCKYICKGVHCVGRSVGVFAQGAYHIMVIIYFVGDVWGWNDGYVTAKLENNAEEWMMNTCSEQNYPILLNTAEYNQNYTEVMNAGLTFATIGLFLDLCQLLFCIYDDSE